MELSCYLLQLNFMSKSSISCSHNSSLPVVLEYWSIVMLCEHRKLFWIKVSDTTLSYLITRSHCSKYKRISDADRGSDIWSWTLNEVPAGGERHNYFIILNKIELNFEYPEVRTTGG